MVHLSREQTVYVYSPLKLWIPYGLAILFSSLVIALGFVTMYSSEASYGSDFSTILRATYGAELSEAVALTDANPTDPLPGYLAKATVMFRSAAVRCDGEKYLSVSQGSEARLDIRARNVKCSDHDFGNENGISTSKQRMRAHSW